ncbi:hypothetical protein [Phaeacidiphilus oryzae]|uniref:hypothetical protein n=1 Tax=Phaeacidiphilus oryzae TaxID=348818 RepID=UPI00056302D8|nr:hypothetical protein [Phaeacidiphilus oryzae]
MVHGSGARIEAPLCDASERLMEGRRAPGARSAAAREIAAARDLLASCGDRPGRRFLVERDLAALVTMRQEPWGAGEFLLLAVRPASPRAAVEPPHGAPVDFGAAESRPAFEPEHPTPPLPPGSPLNAREGVAQCGRRPRERLDRPGAAAAVRARRRWRSAAVRKGRPAVRTGLLRRP